MIPKPYLIFIAFLLIKAPSFAQQPNSNLTLLANVNIIKITSKHYSLKMHSVVNIFPSHQYSFKQADVFFDNLWERKRVFLSYFSFEEEDGMVKLKLSPCLRKWTPFSSFLPILEQYQKEFHFRQQACPNEDIYMFGRK